jgi:hypothetical protein
MIYEIFQPMNSRNKIIDKVPTSINLYKKYKKLLTDNNVNVRDILDENRKVILISIDRHISEHPISSLMHEMRAHLKRIINNSSKSIKEEHDDYYNTTDNPQLKRYVKGKYSPPYKEVMKGNDSDGKKDYKAVEDTIQKIMDKESNNIQENDSVNTTSEN